MNKFLKGSLLSAMTCAVLFTLQGCGEDRAGISASEAEGRSLIGANSIKDENGVCRVGGIDGKIDADCDNLPDDEEGTDKYPKAKAGIQDRDGDGLTDGCEYLVDEALSQDEKCRKLKDLTDGKTTDANDPDSDNDGISDGGEVNSKNPTNPLDADSDNDGLKDGDEIGDISKVAFPNYPKNYTDESPYITDPNDPDSDGDGLSDGFEVLTSKTTPQKSKGGFDTDGDGVSDGIEVCGTNLSANYKKGKIEATNPQNGNSIDILEKTSSFYDDVIDVVDGTVIRPDGVSDGEGGTLSDNRCQKPVNTNNSDNPDKIDALDPTNDSDGDGRPNNKEKLKNKDPLDANNTYPWITETSTGKDMIAKGFVYVPKSDLSDGFWISKYEARYKNDDKNNIGVDFNNTSYTIISYDASKDLETMKEDANKRLDDYKHDNTNYSTYYLPTQEKYKSLFKESDGFDSNNCLKISNKNRDFNIPKSYTNLVCDLKQNDELVKGLIDSNHYIKDNKQEFGKSGSSVSFRATTKTISELSY